MTTHAIRRSLQVALCTAILAVFSTASGVSYTVSLDSPERHLVQVQIILPPGAAVRELQFPVWNALYQVRDFAQFVNWVRAKDRAGNSLAIQQANDSHWQLEGAAEGAIVEYQIYLDSFGPFGAQLNSHHAFLNLAQVLMYPADARNAPLTLRFSHVPSDWHIGTPMQSVSGAYSAENYDRLVDSPIEISTFRELDFDESGGRYRVIIDADPVDYALCDRRESGVRRLVLEGARSSDAPRWRLWAKELRGCRRRGGRDLDEATSTGAGGLVARGRSSLGLLPSCQPPSARSGGRR